MPRHNTKQKNVQMTKRTKEKLHRKEVKDQERQQRDAEWIEFISIVEKDEDRLLEV